MFSKAKVTCNDCGHSFVAPINFNPDSKFKCVSCDGQSFKILEVHMIPQFRSEYDNV